MHVISKPTVFKVQKFYLRITETIIQRSHTRINKQNPELCECLDCYIFNNAATYFLVYTSKQEGGQDVRTAVRVY